MNTYVICSVFILVILNIISFCLCCCDKRRAIKGIRRIPEKVLLLATFIYGALGTYLAMYTFRHKTHHKKFSLGVPFFMILQIASIIYISWILILHL